MSRVRWWALRVAAALIPALAATAAIAALVGWPWHPFAVLYRDTRMQLPVPADAARVGSGV